MEAKINDESNMRKIHLKMFNGYKYKRTKKLKTLASFSYFSSLFLR